MEKVSRETERERPPNPPALRSGTRASPVSVRAESRAKLPPKLAPRALPAPRLPARRVALGDPPAAPASHPPGRPGPRGAHLAGAPAAARAARRQLHGAGRTVLRFPHPLPPGMRTNFRPSPPRAARAGDPPAAPLAGRFVRWTALPQLHRCRLRKEGPGGGH